MGTGSVESQGEGPTVTFIYEVKLAQENCVQGGLS